MFRIGAGSSECGRPAEPVAPDCLLGMGAKVHPPFPGYRRSRLTNGRVWVAKDRECREVFGNRHAAALFGVPDATNVSQTPGDGHSAH